MGLEEAKKQIEKLCEIINKNNYNYYNLDNPTISDYDYDMLLKELEQLEKEFPQLVTPDSPTRRVGGSNDNTFEKVPHTIQMGSLQDVFSYDELRAFDAKIRESIKPIYVVEPKIDGLSVSIEYTNGIMTRGSTRGDGFVGEDVTQNLKTIKSIPLRLNTAKVGDIAFLEVRGEVFMPLKSFEKAIKEQIENDEEPFKNPRNAAAGSLRQKNSSITARRKLDIFVFNVQQIKVADDKALFETHSQSLDFLNELGFNVSPSYIQYDNIEDAIKNIEAINENRFNFDFDIDGAVVKVNSLSDRNLLGATAKFPKWAVAFKYPPEVKETTLLDIEINVGRTGALTPTAVFEPIQLAGTTVSRAVLHNQDFINEKDIRIGDIISVRKAGEIIPEVIKSLSHKENTSTYRIPDLCPSCGEKVFKDEEQAAYRCINPQCPSAIFRNIIHFASRNAMNIDGLGPAMIQALIDTGNIKNSADLYYLEKESLLQIARSGEKSIDNLLAAIESSKNNQLSKFVFGLGIRNIGQRAAELLCEKYDTLEKLSNALYEDILAIDGFGDTMASSIITFFENSNNKYLLSRFINAGLELTQTNTLVGDKLSGFTFVITGTLPILSRNEAKDLIVQNGGKVSSAVSKKTSYLLAGEDAGSKLTKANSLQVPVITEQELRIMIQ